MPMEFSFCLKSLNMARQTFVEGGLSGVEIRGDLHAARYAVDTQHA